MEHAVFLPLRTKRVSVVIVCEFPVLSERAVGVFNIFEELIVQCSLFSCFFPVLLLPSKTSGCLMRYSVW